MQARFTSLRKILKLFSEHTNLSPKEIMHLSWLQKSVIHKYLKQLLNEGKIEKIGTAPYVRYHIPWNMVSDEIIQEREQYIPDFQTRKTIDHIFFKFSPTGKKLEWFTGFVSWCHARNLDIEEKLWNYIQIHNYIESQFDTCWMLHAENVFWKDFKETYLDTVIYADQYKYMEFWRGKIAEMTFYAKQSQNKKLIAESICEIFPKLECIIYREKYDAIAITPWSIERKNQLLWALKEELKHFNIPFINIIKSFDDAIPIPQKSLKTRAQRIENAKNTIFIDDKNIWNYKKVLLIDDFVWSWATLNETAKKLKDEWVKHVIWFAFVWNTDLNYEVINEI